MSADITMLHAQAVAPPGDGFRAFVTQAARTPVPAGQARQADPRQDPPSSLDEAVRELSQRAEQSRAELRFQVDEDLGRVIVTIVDASSGDVLMQIPGEEALRIARMLRHRDHGLIETVA